MNRMADTVVKRQEEQDKALELKVRHYEEVKDRQ
jgi:hypothetical protein